MERAERGAEVVGKRRGGEFGVERGGDEGEEEQDYRALFGGGVAERGWEAGVKVEMFYRGLVFIYLVF